MNEVAYLSPATLYDDLLGALRAWRATDDVFLLDYLLLVQAARRDAPTDNSLPARRFVTNSVLLQGLEQLKQHDQRAAVILSNRFLDSRTVTYAAGRQHISPDSLKRLQRKAIEQLADLLCRQENALRRATVLTLMAALPSLADEPVFGLNAAQAGLLAHLLTPGSLRQVVVTGLGGIGKSTLLLSTVRQALPRLKFTALIWVDLPGALTPDGELPPAQALDIVLTGISRQLPAFPPGLMGPPLIQKLQQRLAEMSTLIVIDNVESATVAATLLHALNHLPPPTQCLLATRALPVGQPGVHIQSLDELSSPDSFALLRHEARRLALTDLSAAPDDFLAHITNRAGGNPLALKLIVSLAAILPLDRVLADLPQAQLSQTDELYQRIYRRAWSTLSEPAQTVLRALPLAGNDGATSEQLQAITGLADRVFWQAVEELSTRSLLLVKGSINQRRYVIHRLTEMFLQTEINRWAGPWP